MSFDIAPSTGTDPDHARIINQHSLAIEALGGGGTLKRVTAFGNPVPTTGPATAQLDWISAGFIGDSDVWDFSDPTYPLVTVAGIYAVSVLLDAGGSMTVGAVMVGELSLDVEGVSADVQQSVVATVEKNDPRFTLACTYYMPEGARVLCEILTYDTVERNYEIIQANIQQLS